MLPILVLCSMLCGRWIQDLKCQLENLGKEGGAAKNDFEEKIKVILLFSRRGTQPAPYGLGRVVVLLRQGPHVTVAVSLRLDDGGQPVSV